MNRHEHPTDVAVRRLPLVSDEHVRLPRDAKQALFQEITTMPVEAAAPTMSPQRARPPRRSLVLAATLGSLSIAAIAGAVVLSSSSSTSVGCHTPAGGVSFADAVTGDPVVDCARIWEQETGTQAPPLAAYDNGQGGIEVLPEEEAAPDGWTELDAGTVQDPVLIELEAALDDVADGLTAACHDLRGAREVAAAELARLGLDTWSVVSERGEADGTDTCTYFYLDAAAQRVVLIPLDGPPAPEDAPYTILARDLAGLLSDDCLSIGEAAAAARRSADDVGLQAPGLVIYEVVDEAAPCTRADVNVGGRVEVTLRGPSS